MTYFLLIETDEDGMPLKLVMHEAGHAHIFTAEEALDHFRNNPDRIYLTVKYEYVDIINYLED